jgi:hypothetical protein
MSEKRVFRGKCQVNELKDNWVPIVEGLFFRIFKLRIKKCVC